MSIASFIFPPHTSWMAAQTSKNPYAVIAGRRISARRKELGMSQEEVAKATGNKLTPTRIANYEQGSRELHILPAKILATALRTNPSYLMGLIDELDNDLISYPADTKMYFLSALKAASTGHKK